MTTEADFLRCFDDHTGGYRDNAIVKLPEPAHLKLRAFSKRCFACGLKRLWDYNGKLTQGPGRTKACAYGCEELETPHLHFVCVNCETKSTTYLLSDHYVSIHRTLLAGIIGWASIVTILNIVGLILALQ